MCKFASLIMTYLQVIFQALHILCSSFVWEKDCNVYRPNEACSAVGLKGLSDDASFND